ncbi:hypothetical protein EZS27_008569 [termite gut metagenome]|uniref:DNA mimic protein DMP19 C-terminal domain-containing protein n=1 Tax=termite gut metagenome TaxID=433724 RepID=A0A5J4SCN2_9ZZZZ
MMETIDTTAEKTNEFINSLTDKYWEILGGELKTTSMILLNAEQHSLLAYRIFRDEVMNGGFCQLTQNGYGGYIFTNPFAKAMRSFGFTDFSKLLNSAKQIYFAKREDLEKERSDKEFMAMYEHYEVFDHLEESFFEMEEKLTAQISSYVKEHSEQFMP